MFAYQFIDMSIRLFLPRLTPRTAKREVVRKNGCGFKLGTGQTRVTISVTDVPGSTGFDLSRSVVSVAGTAFLDFLPFSGNFSPVALKAMGISALGGSFCRTPQTAAVGTLVLSTTTVCAVPDTVTFLLVLTDNEEDADGTRARLVEEGGLIRAGILAPEICLGAFF